jgi:hypothetical protein
VAFERTNQVCGHQSPSESREQPRKPFAVQRTLATTSVMVNSP